MSLRHAILGVLSAEAMTGYDLVRYIDDSVGYVWSASQSQVYPELRRMEAEGLIQATVAPRGQRAEKRLYSLTAAGDAELRRWVAEVVPLPAHRDPQYLKALFFDMVPFAAAREHLRAYLRHYTHRRDQWQERAAAIRERRLPLLRRRLEQRDRAEHDAVVAYKVWVFEGEIARACAEIAWARRGLALIDELEAARRGAARGDADHAAAADAVASPT